MTDHDKLKRLEELEKKILEDSTDDERFLARCKALYEINNNELYKLRDNFKSFDAYCQSKFGFKRGRGYQLANAGAIQENLGSLVDGENERVLRELKGLETEQQRVVLEVAKNMANGGKLTGNLVKSVRDTLQEAAASGYVDVDGVPTALAAKVTQEQAERFYRQKEHIKDSYKNERLVKLEGDVFTVLSDLEKEKKLKNYPKNIILMVYTNPRKDKQDEKQDGKSDEDN